MISRYSLVALYALTQRPSKRERKLANALKCIAVSHYETLWIFLRTHLYIPPILSFFTVAALVPCWVGPQPQQQQQRVLPSARETGSQNALRNQLNLHFNSFTCFQIALILLFLQRVKRIVFFNLNVRAALWRFVRGLSNSRPLHRTCGTMAFFFFNLSWAQV